ncbi:SMP-30/gluconolactonase/LRE family protein [Olivibacter sp. SDN3]|uniref:SMP-30/gluconolactonase/LRE family protein n=1 Tax=Olivibacter sp. SDN3 TaxID=2764720 RepID=UPI0016511FB4|nr:SMP-30/gluconolactonase/LRE family protein [Olivibacter sp. SDN3]QNL48557.1 SMP-30/gluconolactonase/LRE family protein [Olivibacter sp. SDN3]
MFKVFIIAFFFLVASYLSNAQTKLTKVWETDTLLPVPESVLLKEDEQALYVSLIGKGDASAADNNGSIAKLDMDGNIQAQDWISGLNSPKGMALHNTYLYVADLQELVVIDIESETIVNKIAMPEVGMFNDVTASSNGTIYVSDSKGGKIYVLKDDKLTVFLDGLTNPNGVLAEGISFYFVDSGALYEVTTDKKINKLADGMEKSTDGLQKDEENFLISCWAGLIYYVTPDGKVEELKDSRIEKMNTADFAFSSRTRTLFVPTFFKNKVIAYKLE